MSTKRYTHTTLFRALLSGFVAVGVALLVSSTSPFAADAYAADGKKVFKRKCAMCHSLQEGKRKIGPSLYGVFGREAGTLKGFRYSRAMRDSGIVWDEETIREFVKNPKKFLPGTKMMFRGLKKEKDLDALIKYLMDKLGVPNHKS